jgi:hypothetical protein
VVAVDVFGKSKQRLGACRRARKIEQTVVNVRVQTLARYFLIAGVLFVFSSVSAGAMLDAYSVLVLPVAVAVYAARRQMNAALGLIAFCGFGAMASGRGIEAGLLYALVATAGLPIGIGVVRHWTYGWTLAAVAGTAALAVVGGILESWEGWLALCRVGHETFLAQFGKDLPPYLIEAFEWVKTHWAEVGAGFHFSLVLMCSLGALWAALAILRRWYDVEGVQGSFREARVTEWLVWAAIAVAGLWFADRQWPDLGLRIVTWNTAIGLAAIYWLNGLSVLWYGLDVLRPGLMGYLGAVLLVVSFGIHPICLIGLFDTWVNFRRLFDRIVTERKRREQAEQTDDK